VSDPAIALVFSSEPWVERLHRHCADHGGAHVRQIVLDPQLCFDEEFDTLVASHRWPALTPGLVQSMHERGRSVVGVYDDQVALDHVERTGVDAVLAVDAPMGEFVAVLRDLGTVARPPVDVSKNEGRGDGRLVVVGGPGGSGATEVAIELARRFASAAPTALVDMDDVVPAVAPRLGLPLEPNVRTAIDAAVFGIGVLELIDVGGELAVLGGLPNVATWSQVRAEEVRALLSALTRNGRTVVANIGSRLESIGEPERFGLSRVVLGQAEVVVGVVEPSPVGVIRAIDWMAPSAASRRVRASTLSSHACRVGHFVVTRSRRNSRRHDHRRSRSFPTTRECETPRGAGRSCARARSPERFGFSVGPWRPRSGRVDERCLRNDSP